MLRTIVKLPNGTEISTGTRIAVKKHTLTQRVNNGTDLKPGSTCSAELDITFFAPGNLLGVIAGDQIELYKEDGERTKIGVFNVEKPNRPSPNIERLIAYDNIVKLEKDLTDWVAGLTGWPYTLATFAQMVCTQCGVTYKAKTIPNSTYPIVKFTGTVTGRKIMQWLGEICCRFCRADKDGNIEFAWYEDSGIEIEPTGRYYFSKSLSYEGYKVAKIDGVKIRLADSENGALWPTTASENPYIIANNPLLSQITSATQTYLDAIEAELSKLEYTPCSVSIPACVDINPGHKVTITDRNGNTIVALVMEKTTTAQRDTLKCTGSERRDSPSAMSNKDSSQMTHQQIFDLLTNNGQIQGLYTKDGKWYINAEVAQIVNFIAEKLLVKNGEKVLIDARDGAVTIGGWNVASNGLWKADSEGQVRLIPGGDLSEDYTVGDEAAEHHTTNDWVILAGPDNSKNANFGVTKDGSVYMSNANIYGGRMKIPFDLVLGSYAAVVPGRGLVCCDATGKGMWFTENQFLYGDPSNAISLIDIDPVMWTPRLFGKKVQWVENDDGTFSLVGTEE